MILDLNTPDENNVLFGNGDDVCVLCAFEHATKEKCTLVQADRALRGTFDGKRMLRIPLSGLRATICMEHIKKIASAYPDEEEKL